ncbi:HK97 gp10 family phage protein [Clostridium sp. MT-14]|jgi:Mg2+ and Co2+ transporter CorA|uniref:HK97 gp10 family phage protein n=1 Tax=Clostridium sp. MT-14 TaxID=3348360 RepID=UPI0035F4B329
MAKNVKVDQFADEMVDLIKQYTDDVSNSIEKKVDSVADEVLEETINLAPKRTGKYAKGFKKTKQGYRDKVKRIIWNKKDYRRVHLLEFGHALWQGGRARAFPHLRPAYDKFGARLPDDIKKIIRNGG